MNYFMILFDKNKIGRKEFNNMLAELHGRKENVEHSGNSSFRLYMNREVENYPPHWHTDLEIIMPLENNYTAILDNKSFILHPEDILIIPSGEMHELVAPPSGKRLIFQVDHSIIREVNGFDSIYNKFFPCAIFRKEEEIETHKLLTNLLLQICEEYNCTAPLYEASIHAMVISFFVHAGRIRLNKADTFTKVTKHKQQLYIDTFFNLCTYINEHCAEDLTLEKLASMTGFSKSHFIRLFKEFAGVSYYEYLTKRRMLQAEILLDNQEYSIADIAMLSGFNSLATFNRVFRACHNCTPTDYRKRLKSNLA